MAIALVVTALLAAIALAIASLQARGLSAAALAMGRDMDMRDMSRYWAFPWLQASGLLGLALMAFAAPVGIWNSLRQTQGQRPPPMMKRLHRQVSVAVVLLIIAHAVLTALDAMGDSWRTVLIPGTWASQGWPEAVTGYNTGILAAYATLIFAASYYLGALRPGFWNWLQWHRIMWLAYGLSVWHALILGLDVGYYGWMRPAIWIAVAVTAILLGLRAKAEVRRPDRESRILTRSGWAVVLGASILAATFALIVVLSGNADLVRTV